MQQDQGGKTQTTNGSEVFGIVFATLSLLFLAVMVIASCTFDWWAPRAIAFLQNRIEYFDTKERISQLADSYTDRKILAAARSGDVAVDSVTEVLRREYLEISSLPAAEAKKNAPRMVELQIDIAERNIEALTELRECLEVGLREIEEVLDNDYRYSPPFITMIEAVEEGLARQRRLRAEAIVQSEALGR